MHGPARLTASARHSIAIVRLVLLPSHVPRDGSIANRYNMLLRTLLTTHSEELAELQFLAVELAER